MARAVEQNAQHAGFAGRGFRSGVGLKNMGQFKKPQALRALGQIVAQILKQARGQGRAQGVLLRRKGIHDGNAACAGQAQLVRGVEVASPLRMLAFSALFTALALLAGGCIFKRKT